MIGDYLCKKCIGNFACILHNRDKIRNFKMASSFSKGVIRVEKLAIFTSSQEVDEFQIREFFLARWDFLSQGLDNGTMLFLAGVHGTEDGKVVEVADSLETMIRQVFEKLFFNIR